MKRVDDLLTDYAFYHQTRGNFLCHSIGIPVIVYSVIALFRLLRFHMLPITGAEALITLTFVYYLTLDYRLAISMLFVSAVFDLAAREINSTITGLIALVGGWIFQSIGHIVFEKNSPAFFRNLLHLLVGPIFLINEYLHFRPVVLKRNYF